MFEEFENLDDDEDIAFTQLVKRYDTELGEAIAESEGQSDSRYFYLDYVNKVLASAHALNIQEFEGYSTPHLNAIGTYYDSFSLAVKKYVIQVGIRKSRVGKIYSVHLDTATKQRIHNLVAQIKEIIETSSLDERKRNSLYAKLNAFEADVDRTRTKFDNAMLFMLDVADTVKKNTEALNPISDLVKRITELLGSAKSQEPEPPKLPSPEDRKKLEAPKKQIEGPRKYDSDDDIPF